MGKPVDLVQGTLDLLILKAIGPAPLHGWAIAQRINQLSQDVLRVQQGSLYPALQRLEREGWITRRVGRVREQPPGPLLQPDESRPQASGARAGGLGTAVRRDCAGAADRVTAMRLLDSIRHGAARLVPARRPRRRGRRGAALSSRTPDRGEYRRGDDARRGDAGRARDDRQHRGGPRGIARRPARARCCISSVAISRSAMRLLRRAPAFAAVSALVVALGIGTTTAIFSVVYGVMLRPLPYAEPDRLVAIWTRLPDAAQRVRVNPADHRDWRSSNTRVRGRRARQRAAELQPDWIGRTRAALAARLSSNLLPVLRVAPALGRAFTRRRRAERQRPRRDAQRRVVAAAVRRGPGDRRPHHQPERDVRTRSSA